MDTKQYVWCNDGTAIIDFNSRPYKALQPRPSTIVAIVVIYFQFAGFALPRTTPYTYPPCSPYLADNRQGQPGMVLPTG